MSGLRRFADGSVHADGYSSISVAAFAREGGSTMSSGPRGTGAHFSELYTGSGLRIWRIYQRLPPRLREIIFAHYIAQGEAKGRARALGISLRVYYSRLENAYFYIARQYAAQADRELAAIPQPVARGPLMPGP